MFLNNLAIFYPFIRRLPFLFLGVIIFLFVKRKHFDKEVFKLLTISIAVALIGELLCLLYEDTRGFIVFLGSFLKISAFFFLYKAIIQKEKNGRFLETNRELMQSKRLVDIGMLAASVACELRNPLAAIKTAAYNLSRQIEDTSKEKHFSTINKKVAECDRIINNLLFYARIKLPKYELVSINSLFDECVKIAQTMHEKIKPVLSKDLKTLKGGYIEADSLQMKELFVNILNNAFESLPETGGGIEIKGESDSGNYMIRIADNGKGIPKQELEYVLNPFFTTKSKGTGLGLTVCDQIVKLHKGRLRISSKEGKGTSVDIIIPRKKPVEDTEL